MSKGLEALKKIKWKLEDEGILGEEYELCDTIEKELKQECYNKLNELEDIEDELGIDLITLVKMFSDGVYYCNAIYSETKEPASIEKVYPYSINKKDKTVLAFLPTKDNFHIGLSEASIVILPLKDFGNKGYCGWALKKEELL